MIEKEYKREMESDDEPVANLLHELKRVDAPKDFDFRVKARIAAGRPRETRSGIPLWVKAGAPVALLVAIGGYLGFSSLYSKGTAEIPAVAVASSDKPTVDKVETSRPKQTEVAAAKPAETTAPKTVVDPVPAPTARTVKPERPAGGSVDLAVKPGREIILRDVSATDAFAQIGVKGRFEESGLRVDSANAAGLAARSGLKTGDVVESVNGQPVTEKTTFKGRLAGKTLRVSRGGEQVEVVLK